ncbi:MAG: hypothetical protein KGM24_11070, partial [Elusimicrobia bacterium]|nr:hypothetical protein [Elusimicrobiota bacterium]
MKIFSALLALLLAAPALAQVRGLPPSAGVAAESAAVPTEAAALELQLDAGRLYGALAGVHARAL